MEIVETQAEDPAGCTRQSQLLQETISGMNEKMNAILNLLEDNNSLFQNSELQATRKEGIKKIIKEVCKSHHFLAEEFQRLQSAASDLKMSESSPPLNSSSIKNMEVLGTLNYSQLENLGSNPESTVEDDDIIECEGLLNDLEYVKRGSENSATNDGNNTNPKNAWSGVKCKFSKLIEENTQLQVELIKRNSEKRETIIKLQNQVKRLRIENDNLQRTLNYFNRNKKHNQDDSPRKALLLDRFFRGCSP